MQTSTSRSTSPRLRWLAAGTLCAALQLAGCYGNGSGDDSQPTSAADSRGRASAALVDLPVRGPLTETGGALDLAINGEGMFVLADQRGGGQVYARYGRFDMDHQGAIIDSEGRRLAGRASDNIAVGTALAAALPPVPILMAPKATTVAYLSFNLDSRLGGPSEALPFDPTDPNTYNNATSVTVHDAKGQEIALTGYFRKSDTVSDTWDIYLTANGQPLPADGSPAITALTFAPDGGSMTFPIGRVPIRVEAGVPLTSGGASMQIDLVLDMRGATQYGAAFSVSELTQDGFAPGHISALAVSPRGYITAHYDNGQKLTVGQVLLAKFTVADRFGLAGEHAFSCTIACGQPLVDVPGVMLLGTLIAGSLELH